MKRLLALVASTVMVASACSNQTGPPNTPDSTPPDPTPVTAEVPRGETVGLRQIDHCDDLLSYFQTQALEQVGPWGLDGGGNIPWLRGGPEETFAAEDAAAAGSNGAADSEPTATNVQVEGVDEGDIVKAVGDLLYVISNGQLRILSTADDEVEELATMRLDEQAWNSQMLVRGDRLVLMGAGSSTGAGRTGIAESDIRPIHSGFATVTFIDVSDPTDPTVEKRLTMDGSVVTTRLVEGHLRVILQSHPVGLSWSHPDGSGLRAERAATERNREIIRQSTIENWLPYLISSDGTEQVLLDCADVYLPPDPSGLGTLSILDFDLESDIDVPTAASVVASGATVYANVEHTYIATSQWINWAIVDGPNDFDGHVTRIHRFDTPPDATLTYAGSGDVDGFLLNQFAMDHFQGRLRVASTTAPTWWGGGGEESESRVTVLALDGNRLVAEGSVDGLGKTETIRSVRFMGPVGYVVTFRQTDPLYVIDLSDPSNPVATGELKIPGFSAYLHPVGDGKLIGVGQDADPETGRVEGLQISLFDVSDPTDPRRLDTFGLNVDNSDEAHISSPVEGDHKAFTMANDLAYVPYQGWSWLEKEGTEKVRLGVLEVDWSDGSLADTRVLEIFTGKGGDSEWQFSPQRTVVKGDFAYVVGQGGISVIDLDSGEVADQLRF